MWIIVWNECLLLFGIWILEIFGRIVIRLFDIEMFYFFYLFNYGKNGKNSKFVYVYIIIGNVKYGKIYFIFINIIKYNIFLFE